MKKILILLAICVIPLAGCCQTKTHWNNLGLDSIYVSDDEVGDQKFLNFVINGIDTWQVARPVYDPAPYSATYFISPSGSDATGDGSYDNPWWTLNKVWSTGAFGAGDTVYCRNGTYNWTAEQDLTAKSGTINDTIKIWAYPGEQPIFRKGAAIGVSSPAQMISFTGDYVWFKGLEIKDFTQESAHIWAGFRVQSSDNCIFEQLSIHNCGIGLRFEGSSDSNLVLNCDLYENLDPLTAYGNADGLQFYTVTGDTNYVQGVRCWANTDDGFDFFDTDGRIVMDSCWSWYNGYMIGTFTEAGNGAGFKLGRLLTSDNDDTLRIVRNSVAFNNHEYGFSNDELNANVKVFNNFAYRNGNLIGTWGGGFKFNDDAAPANEITWHIRNNIAYDNRDDEDIDDATNVSNNSWDVGGLTAADFVAGSLADTVSLSDARKSGGWLPDIILGHLINGSNMIDAGQDVGLPYHGADPDVGWWESDY